MTTRQDGRAALQLRSLACEQSSLSRSDGAAQFVQGNTQVLAAVYGPAEVPTKKELSDRAAIEVVIKPKSKVAGIKEKALELALTEALGNVILTHLHPRSLITIVIQVLQDDGALLACSINAACVALLDAGVAMRACIASAAIAILPEIGLVIDPSTAEEQKAESVMTFAFTNEVDTEATTVLTNASGKFTSQEFLAGSSAALETARHVFAFFRKSIEKRLMKEKRFTPKPAIANADAMVE